MKKIFYIFLLLHTALNALSQDIHIISLGQDCTVALALRTLKLRNEAYPFDWLVSYFEPLFITLQEDFQNFLNPSSLEITPTKHGIVNENGIYFLHDFSTTTHHDPGQDLIPGGTVIPQWSRDIPEITKKYSRRIERFRQVCHGCSAHVYFIRHFDTTADQAVKLRDLIAQLYPTLSFTLVIVGNTPDYHPQWGYDHIKNYYLNDTIEWNSIPEWTRILKDLKIL